ncbi:tRNA-modifying protein YgfZ [Methyloligella halotolerans]|uniref:tRNA-modifying protein YgfZ n=1 Tax=Methyloligella halotolerans TaxID=1177755 RepID=A0A1E2RYX1_9HYPH|nr:folate-binding protein YgfZ [Methyloligella halotolerans]ODA67298.1 tRNA-modifying protein YgfZ [Methyloligella halotolerans]
MSDCRKILLADRAVIGVSGPEAEKFLQGIITNSMERAGDGLGIHAGLLTPQGKILFDFLIVGDGAGGYLIDCPAELADDLTKRLTLYKLRAKAEITPKPELKAAVVLGVAPALPEEIVAFPDPRLAALGERLLLTEEAFAAIECPETYEAEYDAERIALGVPAGGNDFEYGQAFPHEALFDQLNGVDFRKGCFVGQEVVSRMQHRGTARKRVVPLIGEGPLPEPGTAVEADGGSLGNLTSVSGSRGLALIRLDRAADAIAKGERLCCGGTVVRLVQPDWASFEVPTEAATA